MAALAISSAGSAELTQLMSSAVSASVAQGCWREEGGAEATFPLGTSVPEPKWGPEATQKAHGSVSPGVQPIPACKQQTTISLSML